MKIEYKLDIFYCISELLGHETLPMYSFKSSFRLAFLIQFFQSSYLNHFDSSSI